MKLGARGLTEIPTPELQRLLRHVYAGDIPCPLTLPDLTRHGFQYLAEALDHLKAHDRRTVLAVLVAVIAERRAHDPPAPTGGQGSQTR